MAETHRAQVRNGRLTLDEPSSLPEGTEVDLVVVPSSFDAADDDDDDLDEEDRARLYAAIAESAREIDEGGGIPAEQVLEELRRRHP